MDEEARQLILRTDADQRHALTTETALPMCHHGPARLQHICVVSETYPPELNGVALTLARLVEGLRARGLTVSIVRPRQQSYDRHSNEERVTLVRGLPLPGYKELQFGLPAGRCLHRLWRHDRPDVLYVATEGPLGWSAVHTAERLDIPVLSGFHTNFPGYSQHYRASGFQHAIVWYLRNFHNRTRGTLTPSGDIREQLQACGFQNVAILDRGVDSQLFHPERRCAELRRQWGVAEHDPVALYVGRLAPEKNLPLAIDAYRAMKQVNAATKFVVVGDGPLRTALQRAHPALIFRGVCTGEDLATHYASADIFLFPSETETFGNVTLEAMASGLVVLAYNYAAAKMHIVHGKTGVVVPYGDADAFVNIAVQLARQPHALAEIGSQARAYIMAFDWRSVIDRFAAFLESAHTPRSQTPTLRKAT